ncbi:MAG: hypothetical protein JXB07_08385 [Anaerolineae bacterium]|nr:hypothetical protein [Anaerolineae bacterium]
MIKKIYQTTYFNRYQIASIVWLIVIYIVTALTAGVNASPEGGLALILFEARHVVMHSLIFAVQAWLISHALKLPGDLHTRHNGLRLLTLILLLGIGQEALQSLYRQEIRVLPSLWDLAVDVAGGAVGWGVYQYQHRRSQLRHTRKSEAES